MSPKLPILLLPLALSACVTERTFESVPIEVTTDRGVVTCQLYGQNQVVLDRALSHPAAMTSAEAHRACREEGGRRIPDRSS